MGEWTGQALKGSDDYYEGPCQRLGLKLLAINPLV